jgi:dienelactone hydrolase
MINKILSLQLGKVKLEGELCIPEKSESLVIFAHGSGSSRFSTRNNYVASELQKKHIGTFLFDLLTREEDELYANRFNIDLMTDRLLSVTQFLLSYPPCIKLNFGYFGASTGSASAISAACRLNHEIKAVVSRGGRPDLVASCAEKLKVPILLIIGENDDDVLEFNTNFFNILKCEKKIEIIEGATHLFEEPGALDLVAKSTSDWFVKYLCADK